MITDILLKIPDEELDHMWKELDWDKIEKKARAEQKKITMLAKKKAFKPAVRAQKKFAEDLDFRCLAVRKVANTARTPGLDGITWRTDADKMRAAMSLTAKGYKATPMKQIGVYNKGNGRKRDVGLPTVYDRAMMALQSMAFGPVMEGITDAKSVGFRPGRSMMDVHGYIMQMFKGDHAPEYVVKIDVKSYYSHIQHAWLLKNCPIDTDVLEEFLDADIVRSDELFPSQFEILPSTGEGISDACNLSPLLGNFVLNGMQGYIYDQLYGNNEIDYLDGNMVRYVDDIIVAVRTPERAEEVLDIVKVFCSNRGLQLNREKTYIRHISEGFDMLSHHYVKKNNYIESTPTDKAVERIIRDIHELVLNHKKSQADLIKRINAKLNGWSTHHRYTDAREAFAKVDEGVQTALLEGALKKHPKLPYQRVVNKYWYKEANGRSYYALEDDKTKRVLHLSDTDLIQASPIRVNANFYEDDEYFEYRHDTREIRNVTGKYRGIWNRQGGKCYFCGRPILVDERRAIKNVYSETDPTKYQKVYVHHFCCRSEYEELRIMDDVDSLTSFNVLEILQNIWETGNISGEDKEISKDWKYIKLKEYFSKINKASVSLKFKDIEEIIGDTLPDSACTYKSFWSPSVRENKIAEAWIREGYNLYSLDLEKRKAVFHRDFDGMSHVKIPEIILQNRIPDDARMEIEQHMAYVIDKYKVREKVRKDKSLRNRRKKHSHFSS